jgi:hypothetical protein
MQRASKWCQIVVRGANAKWRDNISTPVFDVSARLRSESVGMATRGRSCAMVLFWNSEHGTPITVGCGFSEYCSRGGLDLFCRKAIPLSLPVLGLEIPHLGRYTCNAGRIVLQLVVVALLAPQAHRISEGSYIGAAILFVLATGQWLVLGYLLQKRFWRKSA